MSALSGATIRDVKADSDSGHKSTSKLSGRLELNGLCNDLERKEDPFWVDNLNNNMYFKHTQQKLYSDASDGVNVIHSYTAEPEPSTEWPGINNTWNLGAHDDQVLYQEKGMNDSKSNNCDIYASNTTLSLISPYLSEDWDIVSNTSISRANDTNGKWSSGTKNLNDETQNSRNLQSSYQNISVWHDKLNFLTIDDQCLKSPIVNNFQLQHLNAKPSQDLELKVQTENGVDKQQELDTHNIKVREVLQDLCLSNYSVETQDNISSSLKSSSNLKQSGVTGPSSNSVICPHTSDLITSTPYLSYPPINSNDLLNVSLPQNFCPKLDPVTESDNNSFLSITARQPLSPLRLPVVNDADFHENGENSSPDWFINFLDKIISGNAAYGAASIRKAKQRLMANLDSLGISEELTSSIDVKVKTWSPNISSFTPEDGIALLSLLPDVSPNVNTPQPITSTACAIKGQDIQRRSNNDLLTTPTNSTPNGTSPFDMAVPTHLNLLTTVDTSSPNLDCIDPYVPHNKQCYKLNSKNYIQDFNIQNAYYYAPLPNATVSNKKFVTPQLTVFKKDPSQKFPSPLKTPTGAPITSKNQTFSEQSINVEKDGGVHNIQTSQRQQSGKPRAGNTNRQHPPQNNQFYIVYPQTSFSKKSGDVNWYGVAE